MDPSPGEAAGQPLRQGRMPLLALLAATTMFTLGDGSVQILLSAHLQGQGLTDSVIGPIVAGYSIAALCFRFVTGAVYRAHRTRWLVTGGCLLQSAAFLGIATLGDPLLLGAVVAVNGVGFAIASTGGLAAVMELRRGGNAGVVMGWYTGCIGSGYAVAGFTGGALGDLLGTAGAVTVLGVVPLAAALGFAAALRPAVAGATGSRAGRDASAIADGQEGATGEAAAAAPDRRRRGVAGALRDVRNLSPMVLLACFCGLHINLLSGVLTTFFPLYGLAIGLSLTQIGALNGMHSAVGASIRFLSPLLFRWVDYRRLLPWMVGLGSLGVAALVITPAMWVLALGWFAIGLSRGILRVSSSALVMDASAEGERQRGAASGVYMAALDMGKIVGPLAGGFSAQAFGYGTTLLLAGLGVPVVFFVLSLWLRLRTSSAGGT